MHHGGKRVGRALAATVLSTAIVAGLAACGDDGERQQTSAATTTDETTTAPSTKSGSDPAPSDKPDPPSPTDSADDSAATTQKAPAPSGASDDGAVQRSEVARTVEGMYRDMAAGDGAGVCAVMSKRAQQQIAQQVPGGSTEAPQDRTCEASLTALLRAGASSGAFAAMANATVSEVEVDGRIATATVSFGNSSGDIRLLREGDGWRFGVGAVTSP